jgi:DNA modification methylase
MKVRCSHDELVDISKLKAHPDNRNDHPQDQIERLAKILEYQGWRYPVKVSNQSGFITSGHGRVLAAKHLGWKQVPVNFQDYDNEDQEYADIVSDNAIASWSELDLSTINSDIGDLGPDFDIDLLGIKDFVIEPADKLEPQCDEDDVPDALPEPKVVRGEVYILGNHRLMCGDSTTITDVERLMNGKKADMVFTDPPYNTGMSAKTNAGSTWLSHMFDDDYSPEEWQSFLASLASNYWIITKDTSTSYICLDWRRSHELVPVVKQAGFKFSNLIVWDKMVHGLGSDYKYTHELIHVFKKGKPTLNTHQGDKEYQDIWHIQRKIGKDEDHATKKPIEIVERAINHASKNKDLVTDLFGGSGSTLIACEKTDRKCFMMELDSKYCGVILDRWQKFTGKKAHREDGKLWDEIKAE